QFIFLMEITDRFAGTNPHFKGEDKSLWILLIYCLVISWIQFLHFILQPGQSRFFVTRYQLLPNIIRYFRNIIKTFAHGLDIQTGTAAENHSAVLLKKCMDQLQGILTVLGCIK